MTALGEGLKGLIHTETKVRMFWQVFVCMSSLQVETLRHHSAGIGTQGDDRYPYKRENVSPGSCLCVVSSGRT